jgi:ABC-type Fe2+-enterobactin transport system substrate-binding protein
MKATLKIQAPDRAIAIGLVLIASFLLAPADIVAATANSNKTVTRKYGALQQWVQLSL